MKTNYKIYKIDNAAYKDSHVSMLMPTGHEYVTEIQARQQLDEMLRKNSTAEYCILPVYTNFYNQTI